MSGPVVLDLSRLLSRADRTTPTGIDRVEYAYARHLMDRHADRLRFAAMTPLGGIAALPTAGAARFVEAVGEVWAQGRRTHGPELRTLGRALAFHALRDGGAGLPRARASERPTYLLVSHHHLDRPAAIARLRAATGMRFVSFVHDVIPVHFPEYQRSGFDEKHALRMATVAAQSDAVLVNSDSTAQALAPFLCAARRDPPVLAAALGVHAEAAPLPAPSRADGDPGYFVCVSTLEPRKNHLLLFNIWRRMAAELGPRTPRLQLVGVRGWHNEAVFDVLDRSTSLRPYLVERGDLGDRAVAELVAGAHAVLMPSFAEGYGLPIAEALIGGAPVICSDLDIFREVGGEAPEYIDPLDGPRWLNAVRDYARPGSPRRTAQVARIAGWRGPTWEAHFARIDPTLFGP